MQKTKTSSKIMNGILSILFSLFSFVIFSQESKEIAIKNFESFFDFFHKSYPADQNTYDFKNYSELEKIYAFPKELEWMMEYDTSNFYSLFLYQIETKMDTLIKIESLNLNQDVKNLYKKFKESIIDGERMGQFHYQQDKMYSDSMKLLLSNTEKPQIGYSQIVTYIKKSKRKRKSQFYIEYNNDLEVVNFGG